MSVPDVTRGPGAADVVIAAIGGRNGQSVQAADIGATWETNQTGGLAVDLPLDAALARWSDVRALRGQWIGWSGHPAGDWGGVVTSVTPKRADGVVSLQCADWTYRFGKRALPDTQRVIAGLPGAVATALITQAQAVDTLWLASVTAAEEGDLTSVSLQGQGLLEALTQLASDTDQEFGVTASRDFWWARRAGRDLTARVQLSEGMEIAASSPVFDIGEIVNDLQITPAASRYVGVLTRDVVDQGSIEAIGRQEGKLTAANAVRPSAIRAIGAREVSRRAARGATVAFDVVDVNGAFAAFREGDTIRVVLASLGIAEDVRVLQRGLVLSEGVLHVTAEVAP